MERKFAVYYHFLLTRYSGQLVLVSKDYPFELNLDPFDGFRLYMQQGSCYHCSIDIPFDLGDISLNRLFEMFSEYVPSASAVGTRGNEQGEDK